MPKKIHRTHPHGGVVCDHKSQDGGYEQTSDDAAVTCLKCKGILSGQFGGKPFKLPTG